MAIKKPEQTPNFAPSASDSSLSMTKVTPRPSVHPSSDVSVFKVGRPSKFNWLLVKDICLRMQNGEPLTTICKSKEMPEYCTVALWMKKYPKFNQMVERSRVIMADVIAERSMTLFDDEPPMEEVKTKNGSYTRISMSGVQRERYTSQSKQWLASRYNPEKYGDKMQVQGQFDLFHIVSNLNGGKLEKKLKKAQRVQESPAVDVTPQKD